MKQIFVFGLVMVLLLGVVGCGAAATSRPASAPTVVSVAPVESMPFGKRATALDNAPKSAESAGGSTGIAQDGAQPQAANAAAADRMIIYSGSLSLVVKDTRASVEQITQIVQEAGGFVTSSNTYQDEGHTRATMMVRVPGQDLAQLKATLGRIKTLAVTVEREDLNGQDVTDQYTDTQADIENLTAQRNSYRNLLDRATKMEDIINIQTRLDEVQGQINRLTGQQLKIKESVKLATVTISLTPDALAQPIAIGSWRPQGTARNAIQALIWSLQRLGDLLIIAGICGVPVALLIGAGQLRRPSLKPSLLVGRRVPSIIVG
jgi:hypothetical protein